MKRSLRQTLTETDAGGDSTTLSTALLFCSGEVTSLPLDAFDFSFFDAAARLRENQLHECPTSARYTFARPECHRRMPREIYPASSEGKQELDNVSKLRQADSASVSKSIAAIDPHLGQCGKLATIEQHIDMQSCKSQAEVLKSVHTKLLCVDNGRGKREGSQFPGA